MSARIAQQTCEACKRSTYVSVVGWDDQGDQHVYCSAGCKRRVTTLHLVETGGNR